MNNMTIHWIETSREVYAVIHARHNSELHAFGTCTRLGNSSSGDRLIGTEWGFKGADFPLIKHEERGEEREHHYFIAYVTEPST